MDRKLGRLILLFGVAATAPVWAQSRAYQDGQALGETLTRRAQGGYDQAMQVEASRQGALRARQDADLSDLNLKAFSRLHSIWLQLGLPDDEARSVAATFQWDAQMNAIRQRAARDGYAATMDAGLKAYRDYQYPLANQLLLAAYLLPVETEAPPQP